jgi:hypothetical protein
MTTPLDPEPGGAVATDPGVTSRRRRFPGRLLVLITLTVVGLVGIAGGGVGLARELTRTATPAEQAAAVQQEIATRWQRLPAGKVFPAQITFAYTVYSDVWRTRASLVGISPPVSCQVALEPTAYRLVRGLHCVTVLRATYVDASGTTASTVAIAVFRSTNAAQTAQIALSSLDPAEGLHVVAYSGTVTGTFGDPSRGEFGSAIAGPYLLLYTAGYTDGIPGALAANDTYEPYDLGTGVLAVLARVLTAHGSPCRMKDIRC